MFHTSLNTEKYSFCPAHNMKYKLIVSSVAKALTMKQYLIVGVCTLCALHVPYSLDCFVQIQTEVFAHPIFTDPDGGVCTPYFPTRKAQEGLAAEVTEVTAKCVVVYTFVSACQTLSFAVSMSSVKHFYKSSYLLGYKQLMWQVLPLQLMGWQDRWNQPRHWRPQGLCHVCNARADK